jgi:hypothetical protein
VSILSSAKPVNEDGRTHYPLQTAASAALSEGRKESPRFGSAGEKWRVYRSGFVIPEGWGSAAATGSGPLRSLRASVRPAVRGYGPSPGAESPRIKAEPVPASFAMPVGRAGEVTAAMGTAFCQRTPVHQRRAGQAPRGLQTWPTLSKNQNQ